MILFKIKWQLCVLAECFDKAGVNPWMWLKDLIECFLTSYYKQTIY